MKCCSVIFLNKTNSTPYIKGKPPVFVAWVWNHTQLPSLPVLAIAKVFDPHFSPRWGRPMPLLRKPTEEKKELSVRKSVGLRSSEQQLWHFFQVFVLLYLALHPQGRDPWPRPPLNPCSPLCGLCCIWAFCTGLLRCWSLHVQSAVCSVETHREHFL